MKKTDVLLKCFILYPCVSVWCVSESEGWCNCLSVCLFMSVCMCVCVSLCLCECISVCLCLSVFMGLLVWTVVCGEQPDRENRSHTSLRTLAKGLSGIFCRRQGKPLKLSMRGIERQAGEKGPLDLNKAWKAYLKVVPARPTHCQSSIYPTFQHNKISKGNFSVHSELKRTSEKLQRLNNITLELHGIESIAYKVEKFVI